MGNAERLQLLTRTVMSRLFLGALFIAGAVASAAVTLLLLALGIGLGFSVVSPWAGQGVSSTTLHISAGKNHLL